MPQYLLLISPERPPPEALSPGKLGDRTQAVIDWINRLRRKGSIQSGTLLAKSPYRIFLESFTAGSKRSPSRIRGPGAPIRYCFSVKASTMDQAIELAASCPSAQPGTIDIFEVEARLDIEEWAQRP